VSASIFVAFAKKKVAEIYVVVSPCLSACKNSGTAEKISAEIGVEMFY
jgi:hypothetical protein